MASGGRRSPGRAWRSEIRSTRAGRCRRARGPRAICLLGAAASTQQPGADPLDSRNAFRSCRRSPVSTRPFITGTAPSPITTRSREQFYAQGVRRYGFHGLSYEYIAQRLPAVAPDIAAGRVIVAHLGSGASMCALLGGRSIESTMGFTALDGLPMGTRPGQIDPGVVLFLIEQQGMSAAAVQKLLYSECGLKGLSGISNDVRELEASSDPRAALCARLFRLSHRASCRHAGGGAGRARCLCVHRGDWRELGVAARPHCREARLARRRSSTRTQTRRMPCASRRPTAALGSLSSRPTRN